MKYFRLQLLNALSVSIVLSMIPILAHAQLPPVESGVYRWEDHPVKVRSDRESRAILEGTSAHLEYFRIHATTQFVGAKPNAAKANEDAEEVIIVKEGLMAITIGDKREVIGSGSVILLLPGAVHVVENVGDTALTYFVLRSRSKKPMEIERGMLAGGSRTYNINELPLKPSSRGGSRAYFDRETAMCERYEMHVTQLHRKGPSHKPHVHAETEIILIISGETEMTIDGKEYSGGAGDLYFMESELLHGVRNSSESKPCSYFAFKWK